MRLGQLARKIGISPSEIQSFLNANNISIVNGSNAKLSDQQVFLIVSKFAPLQLNNVEEIQGEKGIESQPDQVEEVTEVVDDIRMEEVVIEKNIIQSEPIETVVQVEDNSNPEASAPEVIKAPKVSLSGLKVVGKIELPEVKKKAVITDLSEENTVKEEKDTPASTKRYVDNKYQKRDSRPRKNPIALAPEREAEEAERKKREQAKAEKERRTQFYLSKVKTAPPTKAAKLYKEQVEEITEIDLKEPPKTLWGKFLRWLTT